MWWARKSGGREGAAAQMRCRGTRAGEREERRAGAGRRETLRADGGRVLCEGASPRRQISSKMGWSGMPGGGWPVARGVRRVAWLTLRASQRRSQVTRVSAHPADRQRGTTPAARRRRRWRRRDAGSWRARAGRHGPSRGGPYSPPCPKPSLSGLVPRPPCGPLGTQSARCQRNTSCRNAGQPRPWSPIPSQPAGRPAAAPRVSFLSRGTRPTWARVSPVSPAYQFQLSSMPRESPGEEVPVPEPVPRCPAPGPGRACGSAVNCKNDCGAADVRP